MIGMRGHRIQWQR